MSFLIELSGPGYSRTETVSAGALPLVIGRDPGASISIPDPERSVSRKHLSVDYSETGVRIVVLSTVNGISTPQGEILCGQQVILRAGESAQLGSYTLSVCGPSAKTGIPSNAQLLQDTDPFDATNSARSPQASVFDNPFFKPLTPPAPSSLAEHDNVFNAFSPAAAPRSFSAGPSIRGSGGSPLAVATPENTFGSDPLVAFGNCAQPHMETPSRSIDAFLGGAGTGVGLSSGLGASSMLVPQDVQGSRRLAVDHVHDFNLPLRSTPVHLKPAKAFEDLGTPSEMHEPSAKSWAELSSDWMTSKPVPAREEILDVSDLIVSSENSATRNPFSNEHSAAAGWQEGVAAVGVPSPINVQTPIPTTAVIPQHRNGARISEESKALDSAALVAMCRGLGVESPNVLNAHQWEQMCAAIRVIVSGLTELMNMRAEIKRELRAADRTMMLSKNNNPLKSGMAPAEILQHILFNPTGVGGYMNVDRALDEAINDLRTHEFASIAAIRAAVEGTIRDFEPEKLRTTLTKGKAKLPQFFDRARLWDLYSAHYENKALHMADWLEQLFNRHFTPVYSRESERLQSKPKASPNLPNKLGSD